MSKYKIVMKKGLLIVALAAVAGGLTAWIVAKSAMPETAGTITQVVGDSQYRTVNLSLDNYPDFTYAAESAVDRRRAYLTSSSATAGLRRRGSV